jgi:molybdopterin molybdotransferase
MLGTVKVSVRRKPRVAVFSSGDELLPVDEPLEPGKIHDANMYVLVSLIHKYGGKPVNLGIVSDQEVDVRARLDQAINENADLILSTAGVSVGAFDYVRSVVAEKGRIEFWRVNMRPGKPLAFGYYGNIPFIGLPGNPVSAFIGFEVFVRPTLIKMIGQKINKRNSTKVRLLEKVTSDGRKSYLRVVVRDHEGELVAELTGHQGSGNLLSLVRANALLIIPSGVKFLRPGEMVDAWLFEDV